MIGPDYRKPDPLLPDRWIQSRDKGNRLEAADISTLSNWWKTFKDPELDRLIEAAHNQNLDLKKVSYRIEQARAEQSATRGALFPKIGGTGDFYRLSHMLPFNVPHYSNIPYATGNTFNYFLSGFDAIWEIDLFGRLRRKLEASEAETQASREEYREAMMLISAEIGRHYTQYRGLQNQRSLLDERYRLVKETGDLIEARANGGLEPRDGTSRLHAQSEALQAEIRSLDANITTRRQEIEKLIGQQPNALLVRLSETRDIPMADERRLLTQPAETLRLRPDIRSAEFQLQAATSRQGAAIAELFPKISIAAFLGIRNTDLESMFRSSSFAWASGTTISQPIFNFGQIRAGINLAEARQREAYLEYEKTVLEALHECESTLIEFLKEEKRKEDLERSLAAMNEAAELAEIRYKNGLGTLQDALSAQISANEEKARLTESKVLLAQRLMAVYKAIGGGSGQNPLPLEEDPLRPWG